MGGNYKGVGNISRCAEFNFYTDTEAACIVLQNTHCPITIVPWETCLENAKALDLSNFRMTKLSSNKNPFTELLDPIEAKTYKGVHTHWIPCDAFAALVFIIPKVVTKKTDYHATVELSGNYTKGQLVLDHLKKEKNNVSLIIELDMETFKQFFLWVCGHEKFDF